MITLYWYGWILVVLLGPVFGSFCSCAGVRIARNEDFIRGKSRCEHCGHELSGRDLIPVLSFVFSKGRCRYCGQRLSAAYPLSELLFTGIAAALYWKYGMSVLFARNLVFAGSLFVLAIADWLSFEVPDGCLLTGLLAWIAALPFAGFSWKEVSIYVAAGLTYGVVMLLLALVLDRILKKETLGGGDIKLFALSGLYLGFIESYFLLITACIFGLLTGAFLKKTRTDFDGRIPFAPSIAAAVVAMLLAGDVMERWYIGFIR